MNNDKKTTVFRALRKLSFECPVTMRKAIREAINDAEIADVMGGNRAAALAVVVGLLNDGGVTGEQIVAAVSD